MDFSWDLRDFNGWFHGFEWNLRDFNESMYWFGENLVNHGFTGSY